MGGSGTGKSVLLKTIIGLNEAREGTIEMLAVTDDGVDNYTLCPRTAEEIEGVMAGGAWPPKADAAPGLRRRWATLDRATGAMVATEL